MRKRGRKLTSVVVLVTLTLTSSIGSNARNVFTKEKVTAQKEVIVYGLGIDDMESSQDPFDVQIPQNPQNPAIVEGQQSLGNSFDQDCPISIDDLLKEKEAHEMISVSCTNDVANEDWNLKMINLDQKDMLRCSCFANVARNTETSLDESFSSLTPIKVAIIDSGIDYTPDIDVYCRKNFIPGQDEISILYEDLCGHGTSTASIIVAKDNGEGTTGINPKVQLYSAKVLDSECSAPVSRVVEAIYWAIENNVKIINISFGTTENSPELYSAIQAAYNAGILIIAAAGNNGVVEYPAAYDEVMAVGSVNAQGKSSDFSATGEELEIVAPGEMVLATSDFGSTSIETGTSVSAPHVTGVASLLWEQDPSMPADFIRKLLDISANLYGDKTQYGYGLVDASYALSIYDEVKEVYFKMQQAEQNITEDIRCSNTNKISIFEDVPTVKGSWSRPEHERILENAASKANNDSRTVVKFSADEIKAIKAGCTAPDSYYDGMSAHPQWHGYFQVSASQEACNYVASYIYLTKMAVQYPNNTNPASGYSDPAKPDYMYQNDYNMMINKVNDNSFCNVDWSTALTGHLNAIQGVTDNNKNRRLFLFGVALHCATDTFAHSSYTLDYKRINHDKEGTNSWDNKADRVNYIPNRHECAKFLADIVLIRAYFGIAATASDYTSALFAENTYNSTFYLRRIARYIEEIDSALYQYFKRQLDSASYEK